MHQLLIIKGEGSEIDCGRQHGVFVPTRVCEGRHAIAHKVASDFIPAVVSRRQQVQPRSRNKNIVTIFLNMKICII